VPLPTLEEQGKGMLAVAGFAEVDGRVRLALRLQDADWALISDFCTFTLPDFKQLPDAPGGRPTGREGAGDELPRYCDFLLRVLAEAFDDSERFSATIFREDGPEHLAVRLVAVHLERIDSERVRYQSIASPLLFQKLQELEEVLRANRPASDGITFQRVARVYSDYVSGRHRIPTLYIIKPDQARYWTASAGMRDADEAFNEIMLWEESEGGNATVREGA
jgi:hypothetical protein